MAADPAKYLRIFRQESDEHLASLSDGLLKLEQAARSLGFKQVSCGPLVRSSYHSQECFVEASKCKSAWLKKISS